jgi:ComF family protein
MQLNFSSLLSFVFPPSSDELHIQNLSIDDFVLKLRPRHVDNTTALSSFADPQIRAALHLLKFHNHPHATKLVSCLLHTYLLSLERDAYVLVPIPLSPKRYRERGHNQVETLARKALQHCPHITLARNILLKQRHTQAQTTLSKKERLHNLNNAFALNPGNSSRIHNKHVILLDDVTTTGATLRSALQILKTAHPASIQCVAIAH